MAGYFQRQLTDYVEYHRDPRNCAMHVAGILLLFTGAVMPLTLVNFDMFGLNVSLAVLLALPALLYWLALDAVLGAGILASAILLLGIASSVAHQTSPVTMWPIFGVLIVLGVAAQAVGHKVFEQRQPSLVDHPAHFLLGPMFVMAKLFIALGFRRDLAAIIDPVAGVSAGKL